MATGEKISAMTVLATADINAATVYIPVVDSAEALPADRNKRILGTDLIVAGGDAGTPSAIVLTHGTGLPIAGITGVGTGVATALAVNIGTPGAFLVYNGALGTPSAGNLSNCTGLTAGGGGTGQSAYTIGDLLYASATNALSKLADIATGNALISGGIGVAPSYGKIGLTTHISGILPVANGGTNNAFFTVAGPATSAKTYTFPNANMSVGYLNVPPVGAQSGSYSLTTADIGKYVEVTTGGSVTVPDATFANGDAVTIFNNTTGNITMTMSITTAYIAGTDADKNTITLATRGLATILFQSGTVCVVSGNVS